MIWGDESSFLSGSSVEESYCESSWESGPARLNCVSSFKVGEEGIMVWHKIFSKELPDRSTQSPDRITVEPCLLLLLDSHFSVKFNSKLFADLFEEKIILLAIK